MRRSIAGNAVIIMTSSFIVRLLGFVNRVFLSNLMGAEGIGLYQVISPVYLLVLLTLSSGISTAVTRIVSRENALNRRGNARRYMWVAFFLALVAGTVIALLFFFFAGFLSQVVVSDDRAKVPFMILAPCIPVVCMSTAIKGLFYGLQEMMPNAISQLIEQIVRIATVFILVTTAGGVNSGLSISMACSLAMIASVTGELVSFFVVVSAYALRKYKLRKSGDFISSKEITVGRRRAAFEIFKSGAPVSANRFVTTTMATIETILIPRRLAAGGMGVKESMELLGRYNGMAMPLLMLPAIFTTALSITLVPAIAEALARRDMRTVCARASQSIQFTFSIGILFTALFLSFPSNIAELAYKGENVGETIRILAYSCALIYLSQTLSGILNGLGRQGYLFNLTIISHAIRIAAVWFLLPVYGILSYVVSIALSLLVTCILNIKAAVKDTGMVLDIRSWILKPSLAVLPVILVKYISELPGFSSSTLINIAAPVLALVTGLALLLATGSIAFRIPGLKYKGI